VATIEYWIQLEHRFWDAASSGIDRMTGQTIQALTNKPPVPRPVSPTRTVQMNLPTAEEALILRRYTANWAAPADRKVNPWDLNEPNPTDTGTMGTIPGPVIECEVGDDVVVHFRNKDDRRLVPFDTSSPLRDIEERTHSLHPHGFVFAAQYDGAYPLTPPDLAQPVGGEAAAWNTVGVTGGFKQGDRVPPDGTFDYRWRTLRWPTTAGVWLYHDHSICDMDNVQLGAIGLIVIHNDQDPNEVIDPPLPGGSPIGSPIRWRCLPFPEPLPIDFGQITLLGRAQSTPSSHPGHQPAPDTGSHHPHSDVPGHEGEHHEGGCEHCPECATCEECEHCDHDEEAPSIQHAIPTGGVVLELDPERIAGLRDLVITRLCTPRFRDPPDAAQYLLLFHNLGRPGDVGMAVNGRKYLGNTPTVVAGENTKMRFGLVAMGNVDGFHTFHLHGHRWVIPGPDGSDRATIENSAQVTAVSQFEDTRTFGPANSFTFTIDPAISGTFMRAEPPFGEWHMHCHVLVHMMDGMMGSLLIVRPGQVAPPLASLPVGIPCPSPTHDGDGDHNGNGGGVIHDVAIQAFSYSPSSVPVQVGDTVRWTNTAGSHTVTSSPGAPSAFESNPAPGTFMNTGDIFTHTFTVAGSHGYFCRVHGTGMSGTVVVSP
jgi:plastocyanin/FtsP/CotA-like multicopper oxidase with cupredoxin domain